MRINNATNSVLAAALATGWLLPAEAREFKKLKGDYIFTTNSQTKSAEYGLIISGDAAKQLYAAMPFKATADVCTGGVQKVDPKGIYCIKENTEFTCSMGIIIKSRKVTAGPLTC